MENHIRNHITACSIGPELQANKSEMHRNGVIPSQSAKMVDARDIVHQYIYEIYCKQIPIQSQARDQRVTAANWS